MKKNKIPYFMTAFVLAVFLLATIIGCNKENKLKTSSSTDVLSLKSGATMTEQDSIFINEMIQFDSLIQEYKDDPAHASTTLFEMDAALWRAKAYFNVKHAYTQCKYGNVESMDSVLMLPLESGTSIKMDDLYKFYDKSHTIVQQWFDQCSYTKKGLVAYSLSAEQHTDSVEVEIKVVIGQINEITYAYGKPFGYTDDWRWGQNMGYCDYTNPGIDAADRIEEVLNANHLDPISPAPGYKLVYVPNDYPVVLFGNEPQYRNPDDDPVRDNYLDYLIFYCSAEGDLEIREIIEECLEDNEMNFYYNGESKIVYELLPTGDPSLGWFIVADLIDKQAGTGNDRVIRHENSLTFGQYYIILDPDIAFNEDPFSTE